MGEKSRCIGVHGGIKRVHRAKKGYAGGRRSA